MPRRRRRNAKTHQDRQGVPQDKFVGRQEKVDESKGPVHNDHGAATFPDGKGGYIILPSVLDALTHRIDNLQQQINALKGGRL